MDDPGEGSKGSRSRTRSGKISEQEPAIKEVQLSSGYWENQRTCSFLINLTLSLIQEITYDYWWEWT